MREEDERRQSKAEERRQSKIAIVSKRPLIDSLSRSCFRQQFQGKEREQGPPKGAKYKLPDGCQSLVLKHEFSALSKGIADAGTTHIRVLPACDFEFEIRRQVSERELGDWGASLNLVDTLMARHRSDFAAGARVLELGSGLGIPGLVCASVGAEVVLTDRADKDDKFHNVLELLDENIKKNFMGPSTRPPGVATGRAGMAEFVWSETAAKDFVAEHGYFDFVICADCVYQPVYGKSWDELAACLDILCGPSTEVIVALHRRTEDNAEAFLGLLTNKYKFLTRKQSMQFTVPVGTANIEIHTLRRVKEVEQFHIDVQSSATKQAENDVVQQWRGPLPTRWYD